MKLLDFGFNQAAYTDRFASFSNFDRYKKMNTKSNVDMIVDGFTPFSKAKRQKQPIKSYISIDNTDISGSVPFVIQSNKSGKNRRIVVNNKTLTEQMENIEPEKEFDYFSSQMRYAYGMLNNQRKVSFAMIGYLQSSKDGDIPEEYLDVIELALNLTTARICKYLPNYKSLLPLPDELEEPESHLGKYVQSILYGGSNATKTKVVSYNQKQINNAFQDIDDLVAKDLEDDSFANQVDTDFVPKFNVTSKDPKDNNDAKEACEVGNGKVEYDESPSFSEQPTDKDKQFEMYNDELENEQSTRNEDRYFFNRRDRETREFSKYDHLIDALYESLSGREGKNKSLSPNKKLNTRAISSDITDKIYISKDPIDGKLLYINLILDTSGSMSGDYIEDSMSILYVFNELAIRGVVKGHIMLSASGASGIWEFPMKREKLEQIAAHNGGEGFRHTMAIRWKELQDADFNLALTDGQLTDGYIDKTAFEAAGIEVTGMYIDRDADKKRLLEYTGGLNQWFARSIVRTKVDEGIYAIVDSALLRMK